MSALRSNVDDYVIEYDGTRRNWFAIVQLACATLLSLGTIAKKFDGILIISGEMRGGKFAPCKGGDGRTFKIVNDGRPSRREEVARARITKVIELLIEESSSSKPKPKPLKAWRHLTPLAPADSSRKPAFAPAVRSKDEESGKSDSAKREAFIKERKAFIKEREAFIKELRTMVKNMTKDAMTLIEEGCPWGDILYYEICGITNKKLKEWNKKEGESESESESEEEEKKEGEKSEGEEEEGEKSEGGEEIQAAAETVSLYDDESGARHVDPVVRVNRAIQEAAENGCSDVVRLLLDAYDDENGEWRVNPAVRVNRVIQEAAESSRAQAAGSGSSGEPKLELPKKGKEKKKEKKKGKGKGGKKKGKGKGGKKKKRR